ncbi:MAG: peptidase M16, partial [Gammaproteobacteria bacterium]
GHDEFSVVKSPNDDREYRYLELPNRLKVLLISDSTSPKAAAAMNVAVGSGDNPPGREGLAHFLEHMLFLGTQKYPSADDYQTFVSEHGGNHNAYTSFENTVFFFDIDAPHFAKGLDRFAQFFIAPTFDPDYIERERNAVESEYRMGIQNDARRGLDVMQAVGNPEHPFNRFSVGSLATLADRPGRSIRDDLIAFYKEHYGANRMYLVAYGPESLDELQALVMPLFSQVPDTAAPRDTIEQPLFVPSSLPMLVKVRPSATRRSLEINFPIRDYRTQYGSKPTDYVGHLIGHEGQGSLLSALKREGLVESLAAGTSLSWGGGALFSVSMTLTEAGETQYDRILQLFFAYAKLLREAGPQRAVFAEQKKLAETSFRFEDKGEPAERATQLAVAMQHFTPRDVLRGMYVYRDFQPALIEEITHALRPDNVEIVFTSPKVNSDVVSSHYGVPYVKSVPSAEALAKWRAPVAVAMSLPRRNPFVPDAVALMPLAGGQGEHLHELEKTPGHSLWYRQSETFRIPKGAAYFSFRSPVLMEGVHRVAAATLYVNLLDDLVNEYAYEAALAGLGFSLYNSANSIGLRLSGYTDKQAVLLEALVKDIRNARFSPERFANIRADLMRALRNKSAQPPASQVMSDLRRALIPGSFSDEQVLVALERITLADIYQFADAFWHSAQARTMVYGNYTKAQAKAIARQIEPLLRGDHHAPVPALEVLKMPEGSHFMYPVSVDHRDAVVAWYLQGDGDNWHSRAATALTAQVMRADFFQSLRTQQQLGYIVSAFYFPVREVPGITMLVQSPTTSAQGLSDAMGDFLAHLPMHVTEPQFLRHKEALINDILRPDKNLWERAAFYWRVLESGGNTFEREKKLVSSLEELDFAAWQAYVKRVFLNSPRSLHVVAPGVRGQLPEHQGLQVVDVDTLREKTQRYLLPVNGA